MMMAENATSDESNKKQSKIHKIKNSKWLVPITVGAVWFGVDLVVRMWLQSRKVNYWREGDELMVKVGSFIFTEDTDTRFYLAGGEAKKENIIDWCKEKNLDIQEADMKLNTYDTYNNYELSLVTKRQCEMWLKIVSLIDKDNYCDLRKRLKKRLFVLNLSDSKTSNNK